MNANKEINLYLILLRTIHKYIGRFKDILGTWANQIKDRRLRNKSFPQVGSYTLIRVVDGAGYPLHCVKMFRMKPLFC